MSEKVKYVNDYFGGDGNWWPWNGAALGDYVLPINIKVGSAEHAKHATGAAPMTIANTETVNAAPGRSSAWLESLTGIVERRGREILKSKRNYREREGRMREWAWFLKTIRAESEKLSNEKLTHGG